MNFAGHVEVARHPSVSAAARGAAETAFHLGAVLPDLAAMGRFRLLARPDDPDLAAGIDFHHRTDDAFHGHRWFRTVSGAVSAELDQAGLPRGASRACGHVGVELLLDGHLLRQRAPLAPAVQAAIDDAGRRVDDLVPLVEAEHRDRWRHHLLRVADWPVPADYHQPEAVAERLERILSRRPRLALPASDVASVAAALRRQQVAVIDGADALITDVRRDAAG